MRRVFSKAVAFFAAFLLLLFFTNDFGLIDIHSTSIVTAIGIDAAEEGGLDVTAQIAVPDSSGTGGASNVTVEGAATMGEAIAELNRRTGWYPTLVHCRLILLGEQTAEKDVFTVLDYFLRSEFVEDSCLVAVCSGTAKELFSAKTPAGDLTSSAVTKVLSDEAQKTGRITAINLRDFTKGYFSEGRSGFLPFLAAKQEASGDSGAPQSGGVAAAAQEGGQAQGQKNGEEIIDAARTMLFAGGKRAAVLDDEETLAFNLACSPTDLAEGKVTVLEEGEEVTYSLKMKIKKRSVKADAPGGVPRLTFRIRVAAQVTDANKSASLVEIAETSIVPEHVLRAAEEKFKALLSSVLEKASAAGCDLFDAAQKLHRFHPRAYNEVKDLLPQGLRPAFDIRFDTLR